ncbi:MAG TPA: GGDEF domain-containing protein [Candidatus Limnocylindria bacterium]|nr:GGDEF domain-containing protein [Candidatus Limnocylindria bacterium]
MLTAAEPRALHRALDALLAAFDGDGVAVHVADESGRLEPWCARGQWRSRPGDLRACLSVSLNRGAERAGTLDLWARPGRGWQADQLGLIRAAAGALGAALGTRLELRRLRNQPGRDALTGLADARAFHERLAAELSRTKRHGFALSLLALDLDHFGELNRRYGREAGDQVLADAGWRLRLALRDSDVLARVGSDQFAVLLPETDQTAARRCAERLRQTLESHRFGRAGRLTASIGLTTSPRHGTDALELLSGADLALTLAKKSGRRRVMSPEIPATH